MQLLFNLTANQRHYDEVAAVVVRLLLAVASQLSDGYSGVAVTEHEYQGNAGEIQCHFFSFQPRLESFARNALKQKYKASFQRAECEQADVSQVKARKRWCCHQRGQSLQALEK